MPAPTRRTVLGAGLAGLAAGGLTACDADASSTPSRQPVATTATDWDPADWDDVRAQFPLDPSVAQFAAFVLSPHTRPLDAAIAGYRDELAFDTEQALSKGPEREDAVRQAAADFAGGAPGQYALTDSTTMGIAHMYGGLSLSAGDEVLSTTHDFYSTEDALRLLELRTGATVNRVTLYDDPWTATVDEMVDRLMKGVTSRTKVVAITWVHSSPASGCPSARSPTPSTGGPCSASTACTASRPSTSTSPTSAATSWRPARTSGSSGRAAPASSGRATSARSPS